LSPAHPDKAVRNHGNVEIAESERSASGRRPEQDELSPWIEPGDAFPEKVYFGELMVCETKAFIAAGVGIFLHIKLSCRLLLGFRPRVGRHILLKPLSHDALPDGTLLNAMGALSTSAETFAAEDQSDATVKPN